MIALIVGLLLAPAWLTWLGHGLRQKNSRTHAVFWGAVLGNSIALIIMCVALFTPPVMWTDATLRSLAIHWSLLVGTVVGAVIGGMKRGHAGAAVLLILLTACGEDAASGARAESTDSAGIAIVRNARPRHDTAQSVREALRIGVQNGADEYQFSRITSLAVATGGDIYVVDNAATRVMVYDSAGHHVRTIGRSGKGPGEFVAPLRIWTDEDGVAVEDMSGGRFTLFDREGKVRTITRLDEDSTMVFLAGNTTRGWAGEIRRLSLGGSDNQWRMPTRRMWILDLERRTTVSPMYELPADTSAKKSGFFARPPRVVVGRNNVYEALQTDPYRIRVYDLHGRLQRIIERDYKPVRPDPDWYDAAKERIASRTPMGPKDEWDRGQAQSFAQIDDLKDAEEDQDIAPVERMIPADDGTLWVQRLDRGQDQAAKILEYSGRQGPFPRPYATTWDVFDADGVLRTTVALPEGFNPLVAQGMSVFGVQWDADDVQYVARYVVDLSQN